MWEGVRSRLPSWLEGRGAPKRETCREDTIGGGAAPETEKQPRLLIRNHIPPPNNLVMCEHTCLLYTSPSPRD